MTAPTDTAAAWACRNCGNRAYNRTLDPFGERVSCAWCGRREGRSEWTLHFLYGCPMPQPEARAAKVAETGAWACQHCLGTDPRRVIESGAGMEVRCAGCGAPEGDRRMIRLVLGY